MAKKPEAEVELEPRLRQDHRPVCPVHKRQMTSYSVSAMFTYYKCPINGCREKDKQVRPIGPLKNCYGHGTSANQE